MQRQIVMVSQAICYIEDNLYNKLDLDIVAMALHYSKFHLHRIFTKTVGMTLHDYVKRRQLTEAAKLLIFSKKPIIEIAFISGYESQQAFTDSFKAMYKTTPAKFRKLKEFYPLQLKIHLKDELAKIDFTKEDIKFAVSADIDDWMELVKLTVNGYPCLDKMEYIRKLHQYIAKKKALILRDCRSAIGIMGFSYNTGNIDFLAVHPQYQYLGITKLFIDKLMDKQFYGKEIMLTTYRAGDKADIGYRAEYCRLGFEQRELLVEYGYPTQRFVLLPKNKEEFDNDRSTKKSIS